MCLIFVAYRAHPDLRFLACANRDEFHARPTLSAAKWLDAPEVFAGRDETAGGTWLGLAKGGRFAALTNFRDRATATTPKSDTRSRGELTSDFLRGNASALGYAEEVSARGGDYNGFSLLLYDGETLAVTSNRTDAPHALAPGVYGLSNGGLDSAWPKVTQGRQNLASLLASGSAPVSSADLFDLLRDASLPPDEALPDTGVGAERERILSPMFIVGSDYGTRCSTVVMEQAGRLSLVERSFGRGGLSVGERAGNVEAAPTRTRST